MDTIGTKELTLLLVEDDEVDAEAVRRMLRANMPSPLYDGTFGLVREKGLATALERLATQEIDVVLLDLGLPDSQGLDALVAMHRQTPEVPIVVLTALSDEALGVEAVRKGAQDYLIKGRLGDHVLERTVLYAIERKQAQEVRERLIAELEVKNTELERFTYTVSHDLKSPLVTIKGFLGLLEKDAAKGDAQRMQIDIQQIATAADKMQQLLGELLELSCIGRVVNQPEEVSLTELVREAVELVTGWIKERGVAVEVASEMPVVCVDRIRLLEVYQNLIDNAVKFMGHQPEPRVEVGVEQKDGEVVCFVRDNGIGIEPRYYEQIFGLFDRLNHEGEGTGIGLALVKRIVEVHGGRIWVESEGAGRGSTFWFTLPLKTDDAARQRAS